MDDNDENSEPVHNNNHKEAFAVGGKGESIDEEGVVETVAAAAMGNENDNKAGNVSCKSVPSTVTSTSSSSTDQGGGVEDEHSHTHATTLEGGDGSSCSVEESGEERERKSQRLEEEAAVKFYVISNKKKHEVNFSLHRNIGELKAHLEAQIGIPPSMQKLVFKGDKPTDDKTLVAAGFSPGCKVMVVGTTLQAIIDAETKKDDPVPDAIAGVQKAEPLCKQKLHKKVLDKGKPEDVQPGIKHIQEPLPPYPLSGMLNKYGGKVRLTFKLELDQLWIGTKERTEKIRMGSIKNIRSEAIEGHEEYHMMGLQLGPTEASMYWMYWVPAQYVDAIKQMILGGKPF